MRSAVDSNVIVALWSREPTATRMATLLRDARASAAYSVYETRRRAPAGGEPKRLVDFLVGAHALERADRLLTLDAQRYRSAFGDLRIEP